MSASDGQGQGNQSKWINNGDGTYTAQKGATLWGLQQQTGKSWQSFGYSGNPKDLQPGDIVGVKLGEIKKNNSERGVDLNCFSATGKDADIQNNPNYKKGDSIRLLSCNVGGKVEGSDNYAQQLADAMGCGEKVYGPTEFCWYSSDGSIKIAGESWFFKNQPATILKRGTLKCFIGR